MAVTAGGAGLAGLSPSASRLLAKGPLRQAIIEFGHGYHMVSAISEGSCLGIVTSGNCDDVGELRPRRGGVREHGASAADRAVPDARAHHRAHDESRAVSCDQLPPGEGEPLVRPFLDRGPGGLRPMPAGPGDDLRAQRFDRPAFERARVLAECEQPRSVAEVAARLKIPLMMALIVVADLVGEGLLEASITSARQADDVAFLERLIDGVSAL